jgi:DNA-binding LacI/PurR family transcriptional regulator
VIFHCRHQEVELTTESLKKYEMGSLPVKILIDKIEKGSPPMVNQIMLEHELILRKSCGDGIRLSQNS